MQSLLLTDIAEDTPRSARLDEAARARLLARHDPIARELLAGFGGREADHTDSFFLLFDTVRDAVGYAVALHRAIRQLGVRVRVGVHYGAVVLTDTRPPTWRAARSRWRSRASPSPPRPG